jgi:hypothetical protein
LRLRTKLAVFVSVFESAFTVITRWPVAPSGTLAHNLAVRVSPFSSTKRSPLSNDKVKPVELATKCTLLAAPWLRRSKS